MSLSTLRGTPEYVTGKFGQALKGGGGALIENTVAGGAPSMTVEAWVKIGTGTGRYLAAGKDGSWWFGVDGYRPISNYRIAANADSMNIGTTNLTIGTWYHFRLVLDASGGKFYVNGALETSDTRAPVIATTSNYAIGGFHVAGWDWPADGAVDEFRLSKVVRNTAAFTPQATPFAYDDDTLALYHLDGNAFTDTTPELTTVRGTPTYATGKFGSALSSGVIGTQSPVWDSAVGTFELWAKTTETSGIRIALGNENGTWVGANNGNAAFRGFGFGSSVASTVNIADGAWHHLAVTADGTNWKLWVDGALALTQAHTQSMTFGNGSGVNAVGGYGTTVGYDWVGMIDDVRISKAVRYTGAFTAPTSAFALDANTTSLYNLDNTVAPTAVTPVAPTFTDLDGTASDTYTIPTTTGVLYQISGSTVAAGTYPGTGTINITALAQEGYVLEGTTSWSRTFSAATPAIGDTGSVTDPKIIYSPYNWTFTPTSAKTINAGAYLKFAVSGNPASVTLQFDTAANVSGSMPTLGFKVNGGPWTTQSLASTITLDTTAGNNWNVNTIEMVVVKSSESLTRWTPQQTQVHLTGIQSGGSVPVFVEYISKPLRGVAFGDSITEGIKVLGSGLVDDARLAWAYPLTEHLGAEIGVVGFGLQGWGSNGHGGVPGLQTAWKLQWSGQPRSFTPTPDFIVIHMGTNQGTQAQIDATLRDMLATVPDCPIILLRPWNGALATQIQGAITAINSPRLTYVDTTGWWSPSDAGDNLHPFGHINLTALAPKTAAAIRAALGSGTAPAPEPAPEPASVGNVFINRGGNAVAISARAKI